MPNVFTIGVTAGLGLQGKVSGYASPIHLSLTTGLGLSAKINVATIRTISLTVSAGINLSGSPRLGAYTRVIPLNVSSGFSLAGVPTTTPFRTISLHVSAGLGLTASPSLAKVSVVTLNVSAGLGLSANLSLLKHATVMLNVSAGISLSADPFLNLTKMLSVSAGLGLSGTPNIAATRNLTVSAGIGMHGLPVSYRTVNLTVTANLGMAGSPAPNNQLLGFTVLAGIGLAASVSVIKGPLQITVGLGLQALVSVQVMSAEGVGIPGFSATGGPGTPLLSGISGYYPFTFAETPAGVILMANGIDPMIRWDGYMNQAEPAGVAPPLTAPVLTASGVGTITGLRYAFARFIDRYGNPSNLSPISMGVQCGRDQLIDDIILSDTGVVTIQSRGHGLTTGTFVILQGIQGLPLNGTFPIAVIDEDHFSTEEILITKHHVIVDPLTGAPSGGAWLGGGSWVKGATSIAYGSLPVTSQTSVVSLQLLRNLEGNLDALYLDASLPIQTTSYTSTLTDDLLAQNEAVVLRSPDNFPLGARYAIPPSNRPFIINYLGRIFAAGDAVYFAGCVATQTGTNTVQGIGTQWTANMAGRMIYVKGASRPYGVSSINSSTQVISLTSTYTEPSNPFATYYIRSSPQERKMLQWSEADLPEAWPPWNALPLPENNDEITGLFVKGTYLYIAERRHIWRFQFSDDPATTGHAFLSLDQRGAISQRCIVQGDDQVFLMDESGFYAFDGGSNIEPIGDDVQTVFYEDGLTSTFEIDWSADTTLWHASLDPVRTIVRWFCSVVGQKPMTTAYCYNYRTKRWWVEQYPVQITSSTTGTLSQAPNVGIPAGARRPLVGAEARMVLVLGESSLDLVEDTGTLRGIVASATTISLTDPLASFAGNLGGAPIVIVSSTVGATGQTRIISTVVGQTVTVVVPWNPIPAVGDIYQIGGIPWEWKSGWMDIEDEEQDTIRDLVVAYQPLENQGQMSIQIFLDHQTSPYVWAMDTNRDGVATYAGQPDVYVDMTASNVLPGYRVFRQMRHSERYAYSDRFIQIRLSGVTNTEVVRVYQFSIRGADQEGI